MTDFLVRRIARQPRSAVAQIALGIALACVALGIRLALSPWIGVGAPFAAFILAVLVAAVFGGVRAAATCAVLLSAGGLLMLAPVAQPQAARRAVLGVAFFLASSGFVTWIVTLLRAALSREVAARESERLLKLELHHRVKNTLAVVQSLADQTFRGAAASPEAAEAVRHDFAARLAALADAHDLLVDASWREVTLDALAARVLAPFRSAGPDGPHLSLEGEPIPITPEAAVPLALCLHELATNAAKYGALSVDGGRVRLAWRVDETGGRRRLELEWRETGGPEPMPEGRQGFGARLLTRALSSQAGAAAELSLPAEGVRWTAGFEV